MIKLSNESSKTKKKRMDTITNDRFEDKTVLNESHSKLSTIKIKATSDKSKSSWKDTLYFCEYLIDHISKLA